MPVAASRTSVDSSRPWWIPAGATLLILVLRWSDFSAPAFWDEPKVYFRPLMLLYENFWGYVSASPTLYDRPLGLPLVYLPFLHLFGPQVIVIRILNFVLVSAGLVLFYYAVPIRSLWRAVLSIILVLLTPVTHVYLLDFVGEYQLFFCFALLLYLLERHRQRVILIGFVGFMAGTFRESAIALIPALLLFHWGQHGPPKRTLLWVLSAPLLGVGLHWGRNYYHTGELIYHVTIAGGSLDLFTPWSLRWEQFRGPLMASFRLWPLVVFAVLGMLICRKRLPQLSRIDVFGCVLSLAYILVYTTHAHTIPRYYLAVAPFIFFSLLLPLDVFVATPRRAVLFSTLLVGAVSLLGDPSARQGFFAYASGLQDGWQRVHIRRQHFLVMQMVRQELRAGDKLVTSWPFFEMLRTPHLGYGSMPVLQVSLVDSPVAPRAIVWTNFPEQLPKAQVQRWLSTASYRQTDLSYKGHQVELFWRKD